jgi:hypothetical protein
MSATTDARLKFMLLLHHPHGDGPPPTPTELKEIMGHFTKWMASMYASGQVVATHGLEPVGKVLRGPHGALVTDGPLIEAKEIVGGYVTIYADSLEEAVECARACPGLNYRIAVEVRPVVDCDRKYA